MTANPTPSRPAVPNAPATADRRPVDDNAGPPRPASGQLPHLGVIRFAGADAASFLQGQLSNDTRRLAAGSPLLAAYSTPQGRVVALLHLLPHSSGILALLPRDVVLPTVERLRKYVMRAKVQIMDVSDQIAVAGYHGDAALQAAGYEPSAAYTERDGIGIARLRADDDRYWVVGPVGPVGPAGVVVADLERIAHDWRLADIRTGSPQVYAATREMFVAQMLNLDRIDGISFTKGCFTGQEIVARTQHLGRIKRRLFRLRLPEGTWAIGQALHLRDGRTGRLTEFAAVPGGVEALAVLTLDAGASVETSAPEGAAVGDASAGAESASGAAAGESAALVLVDATELPLPYSLVPQE